MLKPFIIILVATSVLSVQFSYEGSKNSEPRVEENLNSESSSNDQSAGTSPEELQDTSDQEHEEQATTKSEVSSDAETNETTQDETLTTSPDEGDSNNTSKRTFNISESLDKYSIATKTNLTFTPSNATTSNLTEILDERPKRVTPVPTYTFEVDFQDIWIRDCHEGIASGDGEWDIAVYVQGNKLSLTDILPDLWDAYCPASYYVLQFPYTKRLDLIRIDVPATDTLSIFTVGSEVDTCERTDFPNYLPSLEAIVHSDPGIVEQTTEKIQVDLNSRINDEFCINDNDVLGLINKAYSTRQILASRAFMGSGVSQESSTGDFVLRYSIECINPVPCPKYDR
jgi:hypothetical protein